MTHVIALKRTITMSSARGGETQMSKLGCTCGHIIRDQTDRLPYKARFLRDYDTDAVYEAIEK